MFVNPRISKGLLSVDCPSCDCFPPTNNPVGQPTSCHLGERTLFPLLKSIHVLLNQNPTIVLNIKFRRLFYFKAPDILKFTFVRLQVLGDFHTCLFCLFCYFAYFAASNCESLKLTHPPPNVFVRKVSELKLDKIAKCFH